MLKCSPPFQGLSSVFDQEMIKHWDDLYNTTDAYTDGWLSSGILSYCDALFKVAVTVLCAFFFIH